MRDALHVDEVVFAGAAAAFFAAHRQPGPQRHDAPHGQFALPQPTFFAASPVPDVAAPAA